MSIEVLKKARDAMRDAAYDEEGYTLNPDLAEAYGDLCQAIAEAEKQEPHSWYSAQEDEWMTNKIRKEHERLNSYTHKVGKFDLALYTHPQPKREWVGLTDEQILRLLSRIDECAVRLPRGLREFARAIEAAHGIKEKNT